MAVYSMHPIDFDSIRTFQNFLWKDMPGALLPVGPDGTPLYSDDELDVFRLSSKSHWDVPIEIGRQTVHFLVSHPTPPVFDGPEDRNGTRNHDEIRFWADYVMPSASAYIYDDTGTYGGLGGSDRFVIAGDQNADPFDGDSIPGAAQLLLDHPKINAANAPTSLGGPEQSLLQGGANDDHIGDPSFDTAVRYRAGSDQTAPPEVRREDDDENRYSVARGRVGSAVPRADRDGADRRSRRFRLGVAR